MYFKWDLFHFKYEYVNIKHTRWFIILLYMQGLNKIYFVRRVWRYQRGTSNQNPCIEEEQTTQWPKEKVQKDKHTHKTKDRVTRTPLKPGVNSGAPEISSSFV
jgi:hypothetical protein